MAESITSTPLYERAVRVGDLLFVSGQLPLGGGGLLYPGRVGQDVTIEEAREAAVLAARRCLDVVRDELGSLDAVKGIARIGGYVSAGEGFVDAPAVIDGASRLALDVLGGKGRHARLAVGVSSLPLNACVEIEMTVQC
jgi:enamine deaminase RidA (YjgF/YER057c/UK114 family)|uniref:RidA family protein n=1 Tax=Paenarthrobacter nicotinovorans TaxID=29320 RepID=UPI0021F2437D